MKAQFSLSAHYEGISGRVGIAPLILELGTGWAEWSASRPGRFTPGKHKSPQPLDAFPTSTVG